MSQRQIIALGGGGFSMEPDNLLLDRYILQQARRPNPVVCFLPTASGDSELTVKHDEVTVEDDEATPITQADPADHTEENE